MKIKSRLFWLRSISLLGKYPFVRILQILDNPSYLTVIIKRKIESLSTSRKDLINRFENYTFLSGAETLDYAISNNLSIARLSDGEFEQIRGGGEYPPDSNWSQKNSYGLRKEMLRLFRNPKRKLLICVDSKEKIFGLDPSNFTYDQSYALMHDIRIIFPRIASKEVTYGHAKLFLEDPDFPWEKLKLFLRTKHVIVVTGNISKINELEIGRTTDFIECGVDNAYERLSEIKEMIFNKLSAQKYCIDDVLVLSSLGISSTQLAYQLCENMQVWDTGHAFTLASRQKNSLFRQT